MKVLKYQILNLSLIIMIIIISSVIITLLMKQKIYLKTKVIKIRKIVILGFKMKILIFLIILEKKEN